MPKSKANAVGELIDQPSFSILKAIKRQAGLRFTDLRVLRLSSRTLARRLRQLQEQRVIQKRSGKYFLTMEGDLIYQNLLQIQNFLKLQPFFRPERFQRIALEPLRALLWRYCILLTTHFGEALQTIILFGSMARGHWTQESDIDLCVILQNWHETSWERSRELTEVRNKARATPEYQEFIERLNFSPRFQHYPLTTQETERYHAIFPDLAFDGLVLYDRENFGTKLQERLLQGLASTGARRIQKSPTHYFWEGVFS